MNEWEWIELLRTRATAVPDGGIGIGDDAAVLAFAGENLLVTTDTFVEEIHFSSRWSSWPRIGRKMAEAAISDVAAMGGIPLAMVAGFSAAAESAAAAPGILEGLLASGVPLIGGDTTGAAAGSMTMTITVLGRAARPVLRSGARPGDRLWLSGPLGGAAAGLLSLNRGLGLSTCEARFLDPRARGDISGAWGASATAMIDISDGFAAECHHLAESSGVRIVVDEAALPLFPGIEAAGDPLAMALGSGEEFELLATAAQLLPGGICVGRVAEGDGVVREDGTVLARTGWTHWA